MTPELAYQKYVSLKLHFNNLEYDYFKYSGKSSAKKASYELREDKLFFMRASKSYKDKEYLGLLISNFLIDSQMWIGDIISESGVERYNQWRKRIQSITYNFKQDLEHLENYMLENDLEFNDLFKRDEPYPKIVRKCIQKEISIETFSLMNKILNFIPKVDKCISERILWEQYKLISLKYSSFICRDDESLKKYKQIMMKKFC